MEGQIGLQWVGSCVRSFKKKDWTQGLFCANFYWSVVNFSPCHHMWRGRFYTKENISFSMLPPQWPIEPEKKKEKQELEKKERLEVVWKSKHRNKMDFHEARNGDHLLVPFEYKLYIFRNLRCICPIPNISQDGLLLACIRHIHLNALRLTVQHNTRLHKNPRVTRLEGIIWI